MSAMELAGVIEGWATLAGLFVVIAGAVFAGVQLRSEARARRFQATTSVLSELLSPDFIPALRSIRALEHGFDPNTLPPGQREAVDVVMVRFLTIGVLLSEGSITDRDIFSRVTIAQAAIELWERLKHRVRAREEEDPLRGLMFIEYAAYRAQGFLVREGARVLGHLPHFDADYEALAAVGREVGAARAAAS